MEERDSHSGLLISVKRHKIQMMEIRGQRIVKYQKREWMLMHTIYSCIYSDTQKEKGGNT